MDNLDLYKKCKVAMFYTHTDHMYNYFDQNVENLYA